MAVQPVPVLLTTKFSRGNVVLPKPLFHNLLTSNLLSCHMVYLIFQTKKLVPPLQKNKRKKEADSFIPFMKGQILFDSSS